MEMLGLLFLTQLLLFGMMLLLSEYTKRHAQVHLLLEEPWALLGESVQGHLLVRCRGFIPLVWFRARLEWKNTLSLERGSLSVSGCCPAGETSRLPVLLPGKNCGILEISLKSFSTWDPLGLFCRKKRPFLSVQAWILPRDDSDFGKHFPDHSPSREERDSLSFSPLPGGSEPVQVDDYRPGDPLKHIHWKLSARYGQLLVKRFLADTETCAAVFIPSVPVKSWQPAETDSYLNALCTVCREMLRRSWSFRLLWDSPSDGEWQEATVENEADWPEAVRALLKELEKRKAAGHQDAQEDPPRLEGESLVCITETLDLYIDGNWAGHFRPEGNAE